MGKVNDLSDVPNKAMLTQAKRAEIRFKVPGFRERFERRFCELTLLEQGRGVDIEALSQDILRDMKVVDPVRSDVKCPYCGASEEDQAIATTDPSDEKPWYNLDCSRCGASGPTGDSHAEAWYRWRSRFRWEEEENVGNNR